MVTTIGGERTMEQHQRRREQWEAVATTAGRRRQRRRDGCGRRRRRVGDDGGNWTMSAHDGRRAAERPADPPGGERGAADRGDEDGRVEGHEVPLAQ